MADWTANSSFGALSASREARGSRGGAPKATGPRAERFGPHRPGEEPRSPAAHAALAEFNAAQGGPLAKARLVVWVAGGVASLALMAGIGVWGYKVVLREVLGLPVVAAAEGPMRIAPADPGGEVVPSQGLAVNAIPAAGTAAPPSDVLMLAPPTPGLIEEDMEVVQTRAEAGEVLAADAPDAPVPGTSPVGIVPSNRPLTAEEMQAFEAQVNVPAATAPAAPVQAAPPATPALPQATVIIPPPPPEAPAAADETAVGEAVPEVAASQPAPAEFGTPVPAEPVPTATVTVIPADVPGVSAAIRPFMRPVRTAALSTAAAPEALAASPAPAAEPVATASVASGAALIQLGAYDSAEIATAEWDRLQSEFGEFLGDKERVIQEAQSGGRTFFRLRASGFADRADASRLCAALTAENADCIPVRAD